MSQGRGNINKPDLCVICLIAACSSDSHHSNASLTTLNSEHVFNFYTALEDHVGHTENQL